MSNPVWQSLAGQQAVIEQLTGYQTITAPTHAWLFTGPPGSGRSLAARAFAQTLQCEQPEPVDRGCGQCQACVTIAAGTHADVNIVTTEKVSYAIEDVRDLVATAHDRPSTGRWRIIIIEDADRMTERATNVLLRAIEEPPERTVWMLSAPSPADVLVTIRSRTRHINLVIPAVEDVAQLLTQRDGIDPQLAQVCARASQSHVGVARWLARSPDARERRDMIVHLPLTIRSASAAVEAAENLHKLVQAEAEASSSDRNAAERASLLRSLGLSEDETIPPKLRVHIRRMEDNQTARNRRAVHDALDRAMIDLSGMYRDLLLLHVSPQTALINEHLRAKVVDYAQTVTAEHCLNALEAITQARRRLAGNVPPLLALEAMLLAFIPRTRRHAPL
ncbi:DNA polymerase III subunit delta' [Enteractinococcus helveticum]|uniref:DNA polymerase III subunit delta n=1 Tax=Enteractinococcus helveticum TaxID=1837282 RepID=A0A1B7M335_9MICC|nr:DNA polymerase III subunit delta' [Enteractinococcus helveticum]OAV63004.1 DNA polymerase III subunit delta' [Enteractinococcus helveticum]